MLLGFPFASHFVVAYRLGLTFVPRPAQGANTPPKGRHNGVVIGELVHAVPSPSCPLSFEPQQ